MLNALLLTFSFAFLCVSTQDYSIYQPQHVKRFGQPWVRHRPGFRLMKPQEVPWWESLAPIASQFIDQMQDSNSEDQVQQNGAPQNGPRQQDYYPPSQDMEHYNNPFLFGNQQQNSNPQQYAQQGLHGPNGVVYPRCVNCGDMNGGKVDQRTLMGYARSGLQESNGYNLNSRRRRKL